MIRVGSLFSGIGGLDLGLERAGMEVIWQVEFDPYCQKVLKKHWPEVPCYGDIKEIDFTQLEHPDLLCGGFPCQPVSHAGKRQGDQDERWLWPEYYRAICEIKPKWILVENVPGLLSFEGGRLFSGILRDLATSGYDVEWDMLSAAAFGAPHLRYRIFLVAYCYDYQSKQSECNSITRGATQESWSGTGIGASGRRSEDVANTINNGLHKQKRNETEQSSNEQENGVFIGNDSPMANPNSRRCPQRNPQKRTVQIPDSHNHVPNSRLWGLPKRNRVFTRGQYTHSPITPSMWWSTQCRLGVPAHGLPSGLDDCGGWECGVPRVIEGQKNRVSRLKCLGNSVVPQIAEWIGRRIMEVEND